MKIIQKQVLMSSKRFCTISKQMTFPSLEEILQQRLVLTDQEILLSSLKAQIVSLKKTQGELSIIKKKRSYLRIGIDIMKQIWKSLKDLKADTKFYMNLRKSKNPTEFTIGEFLKSKQIKMDLVKFLPYSLFLTVPFMELLLPPYLLLFPNSLPSQFLTEKNVGDRNNKFA